MRPESSQNIVPKRRGIQRAAYEKFEDGSTKDISNELPFALPNGWVWTRIGNVCYDFQYGTARKSTKNGNVPVLRMGNLRAGEIDYSDLVYTSDKDDIERSVFRNHLPLWLRRSDVAWTWTKVVLHVPFKVPVKGFGVKVVQKLHSLKSRHE